MKEAKKHACPLCKHDFTNAECEGKPVKAKRGDLAVCTYCATMLYYDKNFDLVILTDEQFYSLDNNMQTGMNQIVKNIVNKRR